MILPFQRFLFITAPSVKDFKRRFLLLLEQKGELSGKRRTLKKNGGARAPLYSGTLEGDRFILYAHKYNGEEDLVKITGTIRTSGKYLKVELRLMLTGSWLVALAAGIVIALVAAYVYTFIGEKVFYHLLANPFMPYVILTVTAIYINLRRYSSKAVSMLEQLVYWLELEEES